MDDNTPVDETTSGPSRRTLIAGMAIGTAGVWAAPSVLTFSQAAAAAGSPAPDACSDPFVCAENNPLSPCGDDGCYCEVALDGRNVCAGADGDCGEPCTSDADCGSGAFCQSPNGGCCGQVCISLCGGGLQAAARGDGSSNIRR